MQILLFCTVDDLAMLVRRVLRLGRGDVSFSKEQVANLVVHGEAARTVAVPGGIVPFDVDACKFLTFPVFRHVIMLVCHNVG